MSASTNYSCSFPDFLTLPLHSSDLVSFLILSLRGFKSQDITFSLSCGSIYYSKLQVSSFVGCSLHLFLDTFLNHSHLFLYGVVRFLCLLPQVISFIQCQHDFPRLSVWPWLCVNLLQLSILLDAVGSFVSILRDPQFFVGKPATPVLLNIQFWIIELQSSSFSRIFEETTFSSYLEPDFS